MDGVAYLGMHAAIQTARAQQISLNNLVNQGTAGFKADFAKISPECWPTDNLNSRVWAVDDGAGSDLSRGEVRATGRALDVLLPEGLWMAVQSRAAEESYTRRADCPIDAAGYLANGAGNRVLDDRGNLMQVANAQKISFSEDGWVSLVPRGSTPETSLVVGRLKLIQPNPRDLYKSAEGLFLLKPEAVLPLSDELGFPPLRAGFLEGSNVNPVLELMTLLQLARHHDLNIKLLESARHHDEVSAALLRASA